MLAPIVTSSVIYWGQAMKVEFIRQHTLSKVQIILFLEFEVALKIIEVDKI